MRCSICSAPKGELLNYGAGHYRHRSSETSSLLYELLERVHKEIQAMPDALEEFTRQTIDKLLKELPPKKLLEALTPEQRLEGLTPEKRLEGLSPEKRLEGLTPEKRLEGLSPEDRLKGMTEQEREVLRRLLNPKEDSANPG